MKTVYRRPPGRNPKNHTPLVVDGYGIRIHVERGHLVINYGTGRDRTTTRYPKVGHGIGRLIIIGHTGLITLEAIRWLDRVGIPHTHIDHDGTILAGHANPGVDDPRLRRAQAIADTTPAGLAIAKHLIGAKLRGQAHVAATRLDNLDLAETITDDADTVDDATSIGELAEPERRAARDYWAGWADKVTITWARNDADRIPDHWTRYPRRQSQFGSNPARASDPVNALLNYLYRLAENECRTACIRLGLDPGLGIIHTDRPNRDSLALDLIEAIRPDVDAHVLDVIGKRAFRRGDFHERDDGEIRLLPPLTHELAQTLPAWAAIVAPYAEDVRCYLATASPYSIEHRAPLTNRTRKAVPAARQPRPQPSTAKTCPDCGGAITRVRAYCDPCAAKRQDEGRRHARANLAAAKAADPQFLQRVGQAVSDTKRRRRAEAVLEEGYAAEDWQQIHGSVAGLSLSAIMSATGLGVTQASRIKSGRHIPPARHWHALAKSSRHQLTIDADDVQIKPPAAGAVSIDELSAGSQDVR